MIGGYAFSTEKMTESSPTTVLDATEPGPVAPEESTSPQVRNATKPDIFPTLEKLASLYPHLFGATFQPLKRGIFQDLMAAHPEILERDLLKAALSFHTRSSRYLTVVASGQPRQDLKGAAVEALAPEHVHQALLEVFRRRQARTKENLQPKLIARIVQAFEASGLSAHAYAELVRGRDDVANAVLEEALQDVESRSAKDEALRRAYDASGQSVAVFADMYGLDPRAVTRMLARNPASQA